MVEAKSLQQRVLKDMENRGVPGTGWAQENIKETSLT